MIDYLIEQNIKEVHDKDVEIGISKLPCYLCSLTDGKIYSNWMFRNNEKDKIIDDINNQLCSFIKNELQLFQLSIINKSWNGDNEETQIDDDNIDYRFIDFNMAYIENQ
ncbi:unnamed protein product [Rotaria sp. Silwood2]|nr:unnamed protein product [Rotaria sp. Silwood2]